MKSLILILIVLFSLKIVGNQKTTTIWNTGQADTIEKGRFEVGIFQPLKYGFTNSIEFSTYPLVNFIMPNFSIKKNYLKKYKWSLSSEHFISYPTLLLKLISKKGVGGLLPSTAKENIPQQIYTEHSIMFSYNLSKYFIITPKISVSIPIIFNSYKKFPTIDMFLLYPRTAPFHGDFVYTLSLDIDGLIWNKLYYSIDLDYYNNLAINIYNSEGIGSSYEHKFMLIWKNSKTFSIYAGYKLIYGNYPYGSQLNIVPLVDLAWGF